jgi:transcriptional regulator with XRE-family HTH domain
MQAFSYICPGAVYIPGMTAMGRPSNKPRTPLGQRITDARQALGMTQQELASKVGVTQRVIAYWEREAVSLRADQIDALAGALNTSADNLVGRKLSKQRAGGPVGKARRLFEAISNMPRHQQEKVFAILEPFVEQHTQS